MDWNQTAISFASTVSSLFAIVDPFAVIPVFLTLTDRYENHERTALVKRSALISAAILAVFALSGETIFRIFGISMPSFRIAGGILLLLLGIAQLNATRERVKSEEESESYARDDISIFPLATPLLAGPGAISTVVLQSGQNPTWLWKILLLVAIALVFGAAYLILNSAPHVFRLLGKTGLNLLTRLMGIILTAIAIQFIVDGVVGVWKQMQGISG